MKEYITHDNWKIIEEGFDPALNKNSESLFSLGNGRFGQRANFEETYTGDSLQGNYIAGIYYPDKTRVGWWKNGYPEYFAKVLNAPDWIGLKITLGSEILDLAKWEVQTFSRELNLQTGLLTRKFTAQSPAGTRIKVAVSRLVSMSDYDTAALQYCIEADSFDGRIEVVSMINGNVVNLDSNYSEEFWEQVDENSNSGVDIVITKTLKTHFYVATGTKTQMSINGNLLSGTSSSRKKQTFSLFQGKLKKGEKCIIEKYAGIVSSRNYNKEELEKISTQTINRAVEKGFSSLKEEHAKAWATIWEQSDISIEGDIAAQQGIRFNIFQLNQTYTGEDPRLNIGPKGFTGEKYGGSTYWDTEAYCVPFYLSTSKEEVSENLLQYRHNHLGKAIENARKLGFNNGAALYPMVTMNGEESHNEWEITFEEIHRNGAIAYAIFEHSRYTGDNAYRFTNGFEVLTGISRFWVQRVNWSEAKEKWVILGVTGPNEYENNVNNNWYTNRIAAWTLEFTLETLNQLESTNLEKANAAKSKLEITNKELSRWQHVIDNMYYPEDRESGIFLQQDGFLDKEMIPADKLDKKQLPLNQHWSWDRILRSPYIKQADVLQGLYIFEDEYSIDTLRSNFNFYEPITVHESSLSPCVHAILASRIGEKEKAYELYLQTARLDLDDYNNDTKDGCHITSMAGTWMAVTKGFGGMSIKSDRISFSPFLPGKWKGYSFHILFRKSRLLVSVNKQEVVIENISKTACEISLYGEKILLHAGESCASKIE